MKKTIGMTLFVLTAWAGMARAQFRITDLGAGQTPQGLVDRMLGGGVTAFNVQYTGTTNSAAFVCSGEEIIGINTSILLSSGAANIILGPNDSSTAGADNNLEGDPDLDALIPGFETFDACVLEFDFVPVGNTVTFNYVFASEEYNEFVDSPFNDVFGFFVNGVNYALIPGTPTTVAINNVNNGNAAVGEAATGPCTNCGFYIDNSGTSNSRNTQMDGLTTVLTFTAPVAAGQTNHIRLAVADAGDHILDSVVFIEAGSFRSGSGDGGSVECITRTARYWFTHPYSDLPNCASLVEALSRAIAAGDCERFDIGFLELPLGFRNDDYVSDEQDAVIEALGLYHRSSGRTGELGGQQNLGLRASRVCRDRKRLAGEYIAAVANVLFLRTDPARCQYNSGGSTTNFPADLLDQAREVLAGEDRNAMRTMRTLLSKFNSSGVTNNLPDGLVECSPLDRRSLRTIARDPTSRFSCPGINDNCASAEAIVFSAGTSVFAPAKFRSSANTFKLPSGEAWWKVEPDTAVSNRTFTVNTFGSNFDTVLTVLTGGCAITTSNGVEAVDSSGLAIVTANDDADSTPQSKVSFTVSGTETYFIRVTGGDGKIKLTATSP